MTTREIQLTKLEVAYLDSETRVRHDLERRAAAILEQARALGRESVALNNEAKERAKVCLNLLASQHKVEGGFPPRCDILRKEDEVTFRWDEADSPAETDEDQAAGDAPTEEEEAAAEEAAAQGIDPAPCVPDLQAEPCASSSTSRRR